jgi:RHS repeat-associated protein
VDGAYGSPCSATATLCFSYNALGARAWKNISQGSDYRYYYYDAFGRLAMVTSPAAVVEDLMPPVAGRYYAKYQDGNTYFLHPNALGTVGMVTDQADNTVQDATYYPWGQQWQMAGAAKDQRWAGMQEREPESLSWQDPMDPTPNRAYTSNLGRWFTPDPLAGDISNPQSLNRYAYVLNNPTTLTDPLGLGQCPPGTSPMGTAGQCRGIEGPGSGNNQVGPSTTCMVDGVEDPGCTTLANATRGWTNGVFEAAVNQSIANSTVTVGYPYYWLSPSSASMQWGGVITVLDNWESGTLQFTYSLAAALSYVQPCFGGDAYCNLLGNVVRAHGNIESDDFANMAIAGAGTAALRVGGEVVDAASSMNFKVGLHPAHHYFPKLGGKFVHFQINWWRAGIPGSGAGNVIRVALPWWPFPWP